MAIVTLITDFGTHDYYGAVLKGAILKGDSRATIIDITNDITPFDIVQAAFVLKNSFYEFSDGSLHIVSVNNSPEAKGFVLFKHSEHFFLGPDNGIFSLAFPNQDIEAYSIAIEADHSFPLKDASRKAVEFIKSGKHLRDAGQKVDEIEKRIALQPVISTSQIRGSIVYVDHYENVIVNVNKELFERVRNGREFELYFKRFEPIRKLSTHYSDVSVGETLCWFNSAGFLEISINMGKAAGMHGLKLDDMVQIDFLNP